MLQPSIRKALDALDSLSDVPEASDLARFEREGKITDGRKAAAARVYEVLKDILHSGSAQKRYLAVFLDGLPGSGKSGMSEKLRNGVQDENLLGDDQVAILPLDWFIGTESGSAQRQALTRDAQTFDAGYLRYDLARNVTRTVLELMGSKKSCNIPIQNKYCRDLGGKFQDGEFVLGEDVRLLIIEGVGAINRVAGPNGFPPQVDRHTIFMYGQNRQSLFRATLRDMRRKPGSTFEQEYMKRAGEYRYLLPQLRFTPRSADQVCRRYKDDAEYLRRLQESDADDNSSVSRVISMVHSDFLRRVVPDPQILSVFSAGKRV
jgi:hypothetical protein